MTPSHKTLELTIIKWFDEFESLASFYRVLKQVDPQYWIRLSEVMDTMPELSHFLTKRKIVRDESFELERFS